MTAARPYVALTMVRPLVAAGVLALAPCLTHALAAEPAGATVAVKLPAPTWAWRQAVQDEMDSHVATVQAKQHGEPLSPLLVHAGADPDLVTMAPVRVNGARLAQEIKREYAIAQQQEKDAAVLHRLGTGMHMAGNSHFGVLTVFYVPVFAGFRWSW